MDGERFISFVRNVLVPHLMPYNTINPKSIVIMDDASIHHIDEVADIIEAVGAKLFFLPPYSRDLNRACGRYI